MAFSTANSDATPEVNELEEDILDMMVSRGFEGYSLFYWEYILECQLVAYNKWLNQLGRESVPEILSELKRYRFSEAYTYAYDAEIPLRDNNTDIAALAKTTAQRAQFYCNQIGKVGKAAAAKFIQATKG